MYMYIIDGTCTSISQKWWAQTNQVDKKNSQNPHNAVLSNFFPQRNNSE